MQMPFRYIGYSSLDPRFQLTDFDLVLRDLQNNIDTMYGECDWCISQGNRTIEYIHSLQSSNMTTLLENEINRIIKLDPRLTPVSIDVVEINQLYYVNCVVQYLGENKQIQLTFGANNLN